MKIGIVLLALLLLVGCESKIKYTKVIVQPQSTFIDDVPADDWKNEQDDNIKKAKYNSLISTIDYYVDIMNANIARINASGGAEGQAYIKGNEAIGLYNEIVGLYNAHDINNLDTIVEKLKTLDGLLQQLGYI